MSPRGGDGIGDLFSPPAYNDRGAREAGSRTPTRWRGWGDKLLERPWRDLFDWVGRIKGHHELQLLRGTLLTHVQVDVDSNRRIAQGYVKSPKLHGTRGHPPWERRVI